MKVLRAAVEAMQRGQEAALVTVIGVRGSAPRHAGSRMLVLADGSIVGTIGGGAFEFRVIEQARLALAEGAPRRYQVHLTLDLGMCCGGQMEVYIEPLQARDHLYVFGAGHVGAATARLAAALEFAVHVIDERSELLEAATLPADVERIDQSPRRFARQLEVGPRSWLLVVTHDHALDQDLVELFLPQPFAWLGMIGSRTKVQRFRLRLRAAGVDERLFDRLRAPVGLDIGAESPEEIALSIASELVARRRGAQAVLQHSLALQSTTAAQGPEESDDTASMA